ncbi:MAG: MFS transporter [Galbitalea sp.]
MTDAIAETGPAERFSPALRRAIGVVMIGATLSFLDTTIVNVAVHSLAGDLHAGLSSVQWVVTAYLLALAAVIPVTGWAARRFGAARLYVAALVVFTIGSVWCACSQSLGMLIAARVLQGIGGGAIMPVGTIIWTAHATKNQMGKVIALLAIPIIFAPAIGPSSAVCSFRASAGRRSSGSTSPSASSASCSPFGSCPWKRAAMRGRFDVIGLILASAGIVGITYGVAELGVAGGLDAAAVVGLLVGVLALAGFVLHALRSKHPLLDVRLYANREFTAAMIATFALGAANYGGMILMPLYLQTVRGEDVIIAGLLVAPTAIGALISAPFTDRFGPGITSFTGAAILAVATIPFLFLTTTTRSGCSASSWSSAASGSACRSSPR